MAIAKRGRKYQVKVRGLNDEWWTQTVPSRADAEHVEREMESAKARGENWLHPRARQTDRLTLRTVAEAFIDAQRHRLALRTLLRYGAELEDFTMWAEARDQGWVSSLSRPLLRAYLAHVVSSRAWGGDRAPGTTAKIMKTVMLLWAWADENADDYGWTVPRARRIDLPSVPPPIAVAPTWAEVDDMLSALDDAGDRFELPWAWRAAMVQRFTAGRIGEVLALRWDDIDLDRARLRFRVTKGGYGGRELPLSQHLVHELRRWDRWDAWVVGEHASKLADTSRPARVMATAWRAAGVRPAAWDGQQTHAIRKAVISGLSAKGAHRDAVELFAGHSLGAVRAAYIDPAIALDLVAMVKLIPAIGAEE